MFQTIQGKMVGIFMAFALLLAMGGASSYVILTRHTADGLVVNLAGRQRMLTQKMTKEAMQLAAVSALGNADRVSEARERLKETIRVFEATLIALEQGGAAPANLEMTVMKQVPPPESGEVRRQLGVVVNLWKPFKEKLEAVMRTQGHDMSALSGVADANMKVMAQMDAAVTLMQAESDGKVRWLYLIQTAALGLGVILVVVGASISRSSIARPISELANAAREMSTGNLNVELHLHGTREVEELGASFDRMRASMLAVFGGGTPAHEDL